MKGDLRDRVSLRLAVSGVETVVHAASYVGYDARLGEEVNQDGTATLVEEALRAGVTRFIYVSTVGVLGRGPHRGTVKTPEPGSLSVLSQSRREAEKTILGAGGISVRPALVVGKGDKWVVPQIQRLTKRIGGVVDSGSAQLSMIHVRDVGKLVASLAHSHPPPHAPRSFIAANPQPIAVSELVQMLELRGLLRATNGRSFTREEAGQAVGPTSIDGLRALTNDYWFEADDLWKLSGVLPPDTLQLRTEDIDYYRRLLKAKP
jgi:nucleoside-diphosphate-sugar epimerase